MQPQQPQQPQQQPPQPQYPAPLGPQPGDPNFYPTDYLNQIAPQPQQPGVNNRLLFIIIGIAVLVIGLFGFLMLASSPKTADLQALGTKVIGLQEIAESAQENIKGSDLRSVNSSFVLYLSNTDRELQKVMTANGTKFDKKATDDTLTKMTETLEEARVSDLFDRTYADELRDQLTRIDILINSAYKKTSSKSAKTFLEAASKDLESFYAQLEDFSTKSSS